MSAMLGRSGTWFYGPPCGATSRVMRRSGRQREHRAAEREVAEQLEPVDPICLHSWECSTCRPAWPYDEEPMFHGE